MKIALCTPFKPLDHPTVSGDVTIARDLADALESFGHTLTPLPFFSAKKIYERPEVLADADRALDAMIEAARGADCWLTYGTYYKVPDIFGPDGSEELRLPYFIFQASYAVNRAQNPETRPGYMLNKRAMLRADHIFCNRVNDLRGCARILPDDRYSPVRPGLPDGLFGRDEAARKRLREIWGVGDSVVVTTAAMMRHGVKAEGVRWVVETCADLIRQGRDLRLVVAGDGPRRGEIEAMATKTLGGRVRFLGMVERSALAGVLSAGDLFAFPGLEESVGMVYLEAQRCGLPAVATDDEGAPHVIDHQRSGLITPVEKTAFTEAVGRLADDPVMRRAMGAQAMDYVQKEHMAAANYREMAQTMERIVKQRTTR